MTERVQLVPGELYRVSFDDCCVEGEFVARFVRYEYEDGEQTYVIFEHGTRIGPMWGAWKVEPVTSP